MSAAVIDPGLAAALAVGSIPYIQVLYPLTPRMVVFLPAILLLILAGINYVGTRLSTRVMATVNLLKVSLLFALVAWAWISGHASTANLLPLAHRRAGSEALFAAIASATINAFFSFGGWWEVGKIAGEVRNPRRNLPLAFTCGVCWLRLCICSSASHFSLWCRWNISFLTLRSLRSLVRHSSAMPEARFYRSASCCQLQGGYPF